MDGWVNSSWMDAWVYRSWMYAWMDGCMGEQIMDVAFRAKSCFASL
jgi:hypothetical protein